MIAHLTYAPLDTVEPADCLAAPSAARCSCGKCGKTYTQGAVVTDHASAAWSDAHQTWAVHRSLYCDHCRHVIHWLESCRLKGPLARVAAVPTGLVLSGPGYVRGARAVDRFLARHPQAAGVSQS